MFANFYHQTNSFPIWFSAGFLGSFLSNSLKTNQLEVNTDARTLRPVARLKEPRDLFALPKERDNDCSQQAPRYPNEMQVSYVKKLDYLSPTK